ncbi:hypothetical protein SNEBB_002274 [Seison nebaliae]|nr:hypothetical protein SNEBB_002274 [Seison nebaliae]
MAISQNLAFIIYRKKFQNWAGTFGCTPQKYYLPKNERDIENILSDSRKKNLIVRMVGCGHSPSDIVCSPDVLIDMKDMNKVISVNEEEKSVVVEAGATMTHLMNELLKHDLQLPIVGSITNVTVGGVLGCATHSSGKSTHTFGHYVLQYDVMLSNGEIKTLNPSDGDEFLALGCHLGCLGVILRVKLQVEERFKLSEKRFIQSIEQLNHNLHNLITTSDYFRMLYFPYTRKCVCYSMNRTNKEIFDNSSWFVDKFCGYYLLEFFYFVSKFLPSINKWINRWLFRTCYEKSAHRIGYANDIYQFECLFKQYVTEWSFDYSRATKVITELADIIDNHPNIKAHSPIDIRFISGDNCLLSPTGNRPLTCYIGIIMYRPYGFEIQKDEYWKCYEQLMRRNGGKPHWAKAFDCPKEELERMYGENFEKFNSIRSSYDSLGLFQNDYINRVEKVVPSNDI